MRSWRCCGNASSGWAGFRRSPHGRWCGCCTSWIAWRKRRQRSGRRSHAGRRTGRWPCSPPRKRSGTGASTRRPDCSNRRKAGCFRSSGCASRPGWRMDDRNRPPGWRRGRRSSSRIHWRWTPTGRWCSWSRNVRACPQRASISKALPDGSRIMFPCGSSRSNGCARHRWRCIWRTWRRWWRPNRRTPGRSGSWRWRWQGVAGWRKRCGRPNWRCSSNPRVRPATGFRRRCCGRRNGCRRRGQRRCVRCSCRWTTPTGNGS